MSTEARQERPAGANCGTAGSKIKVVESQSPANPVKNYFAKIHAKKNIVENGSTRLTITNTSAEQVIMSRTGAGMQGDRCKLVDVRI